MNGEFFSFSSPHTFSRHWKISQNVPSSQTTKTQTIHERLISPPCVPAKTICHSSKTVQFFLRVEKNSRKRGHPGSKRFAWCATRRPSLGVLGGSGCHFFGDLRGDGLPLWAEMWQKMEWWDDKVVIPVFMKHFRWCRISSKRCKKLGSGFNFFHIYSIKFFFDPSKFGHNFKWRMELKNDALEDDFPVELGDFFRFQLWPAQPSTHLRLWPTDRYLTLQCQQVGWLEVVFLFEINVNHINGCF